MKLTPRKKAAKKAARTRAANQAREKYLQEVVRPATIRLQSIMRFLLNKYISDRQSIWLRWTPARGNLVRGLKGGAQYGELVGFKDGYFLIVKVEGYKRPQVFHPADWEFLRP